MGRALLLTRRGTRIRAVLLVAFLVAALSAGFGLAACGGEGEEGTQAGGGTEILRLASWMTVSTWDPRASSSNEVLFLANIYEPLLYANPPGSAEPFTPCLATSWEVSDDGLTWTFHLREGVKFHDGEPFNAKAVKKMIEATLKFDLGSAYMWYPVERIATPDEYTVKITTSYPAAMDRVATAMYGAWMFSPKAADKSTKWWDAPHEAGTGPWMLESYSPNEETVLVRNPDYWGGWKDDQFQKVVIKYVDEAATQRQMLEAGEVDYADALALDSIPALEGNPDVKIIKIPSVQNYVLQFNTQRKPLDDKLVRQALSYALPYEDIVELGANGYAVQSRGPTPENLYPHDPDLFQYSYDLDTAKQLLAQAGYPDGGFKLKLTYPSDEQYAPKFVPLIKEAYAKLGIDVDLQPLLFEQQWAMAKGAADKRQDLFALIWWPGYPDGYDSLYCLFHTEEDPLWNLSYWYDKSYDDMIDTAASDEPTDPDKAMELYSQAMAMVVDEAPAAFLFDPMMVYGLSPSLKLDEMALNPNYTQVLSFYHVTR
jgi:peptide/nickel transport system substrate-binding protein